MVAKMWYMISSLLHHHVDDVLLASLSQDLPLMKLQMLRVLLKFSFLCCNPLGSLVHAISLLAALSYSFLSAILSLLQGLSCSLHCTSPHCRYPFPALILQFYTAKEIFKLICFAVFAFGVLGMSGLNSSLENPCPFQHPGKCAMLFHDQDGNHITHECEIWEHTAFLEERD